MKGMRFSAVASGIKGSGLDLGLVYFDEPMRVASLYTRNRVKAAHILYNKKREKGSIRALVVNSGCANACCGKEGIGDLARIAEAVAGEIGVERDEILFASTGVIGKRLPVERMIAALPALKQNLGTRNVELFARSMMTTDTYHKIVQARVTNEDHYTMVGVAKGAGMINPLFATMLSFVFCDACVPPDVLRRIMPALGRESFEKITVDGDTSTNDTILVFVKGEGEEARRMDLFREKLSHILKGLALLVVKDGEGATKVIHVTVKGTKRKDGAERIARRIATSPLVKTAFFGCDPNWGRIMAALGDAGVPVQPDRVEIRMQGKTLVANGTEAPFSEEKLKRLMDTKEIELLVDLHDGRAAWDVYTTDLTYDYIKINASYRT